MRVQVEFVESAWVCVHVVAHYLLKMLRIRNGSFKPLSQTIFYTHFKAAMGLSWLHVIEVKLSAGLFYVP